MTEAQRDEDPWGQDSPALTVGRAREALPARLAVLATLAVGGGRSGRRVLDRDADPKLVDAVEGGWAREEELPEVAALAPHGWWPLGSAPNLVGLPAAWPAQHRGWVPDRLPRFALATPAHGPGWVEPPSEADRRDDAEWRAQLAADCGLPPPPEGRLWLLRSPWPSLGMAVVCHLVARRGAELIGPGAGAREIHAGAVGLLAWSEQQVWDWWDRTDGEHAAVARAWAAQGQWGEPVADLVLAGLGPAGLAVLTGDGGSDHQQPGEHPDEHPGGRCDRAQALAWTRTAGSVARALAWRRAGFPADPPPDRVGYLFSHAEPADVVAWRAAGFTLEEIATATGLRSSPEPPHPFTLERAVVWRDAGMGPAEVDRLLSSDPWLSLAEAVAFDVVGIGPVARRGWVARGFGAAEARAYTDGDVYPEEARVWRAAGHTATEARAHRHAGGSPLPLEMAGAGWTACGDAARRQRSYSVLDPPGTRGVVATRHERLRRPAWPAP